MAERMLKFVGTPQAMPEKRAPAERRHDFQEIYSAYARDKADVRLRSRSAFRPSGVARKCCKYTGWSWSGFNRARMRYDA